MQIAIDERSLPGNTVFEKFTAARDFGAHGVTLAAINMTDHKVEEVARAESSTGVRAAMIDHGWRELSILDPDWTRREAALAELRDSICLARDLGADGVIFVPHYGALLMPDLTPYLSPVELGTEMLHMHLRSLSDFAYAIGVTIYMQPVNQHESHFMNTLEQGGKVARRINHPHVKVAAHSSHMAAEEHDIASALREQTDVLGWLTLAYDEQATDFDLTRDAVKTSGYAGWITLNVPPDHVALVVDQVRATGLFA